MNLIISFDHTTALSGDKQRNTHAIEQLEEREKRKREVNDFFYYSSSLTILTWTKRQKEEMNNFWQWQIMSTTNWDILINLFHWDFFMLFSFIKISSPTHPKVSLFPINLSPFILWRSGTEITRWFMSLDPRRSRLWRL